MDLAEFNRLYIPVIVLRDSTLINAPSRIKSFDKNCQLVKWMGIKQQCFIQKLRVIKNAFSKHKSQKFQEMAPPVKFIEPHLSKLSVSHLLLKLNLSHISNSWLNYLAFEY